MIARVVVTVGAEAVRDRDARLGVTAFVANTAGAFAVRDSDASDAVTV